MKEKEEVEIETTSKSRPTAYFIRKEVKLRHMKKGFFLGINIEVTGMKNLCNCLQSFYFDEFTFLEIAIAIGIRLLIDS